MRRTRVLHVIRPAEGGMKGHLLSLAAGLSKQGFDVEIACPANTGLTAEVDKLGLVVHPIDLVGPLHPVRDAACIGQLCRIMRQGQFGIIHLHGAKAGLVGRIAAVLAGCRHTVLTVHNFIVYPEVPLPKKLAFRYGERALSRVTSKIITVSEALREDLIRNFRVKPDKITRVYNGIDTGVYAGEINKTKAKACYGLKPDAVVVGTVARMAPQKGLNYLIEAVLLLHTLEPQSAQNVVFVIAGDGPMLGELQELAQRLGIAAKILFPGYVADMPGFLPCLDLLVIPSIAEGLSITTIEAMAAGLPVVASRVGGLPELVRNGENGYLVPPRDPQALAKAISALLADAPGRREMGQKGRRLAAARFSSDSMVAGTAEIYRALLAEAEDD